MKPITDCIKFVRKIYLANQTTSDNNTVLRKNIWIMIIVFKTIFVVYGLAVFACFVQPLFGYLVFDELMYMLPGQLPGVDGTTPKGFILLTIFHSLTLFIAFFGTTGNDAGFTSILLNGFALTELMQKELNRIDLMAAQKKVFNEAAVKKAVQNLIQMHQDFRS